MKNPDPTLPTDIDEWKQKEEMKRLRRNLLGIESYGWDGNKLKRDEEKW